MTLRGDLTSVGLADVFQMLALNRKKGFLSIQASDAWRALYFEPRGVTLYYNEHIYLDRLLDALVRRHLMNSDVLLALRRENSGDPFGTVETLLGTGVITEEVFLDVFRTQMEEEIYDLFLWEQVHWEFIEGSKALEGREGVINENFFLNPDAVVMEAARRLDEWVFIRERVSDISEIFQPVPNATGKAVVDMSEAQASILDLIDGKRNVQRIIDISGITSFHVFKTVAQFVIDGYIKPLSEKDFIQNAEQCVAEARYEDGINLLEKAIGSGIGLPDSYHAAAKTYEMHEEFAKANWHYKAYGRELVEQGLLDEAVEIFQHCLKSIPTDLDAWEHLVQYLIVQTNPAQDPHQCGKDLIDLYLDLDEPERARRVIEGLLKAKPADTELKKTLISVHSKAGDTQRVMELYESIADDLAKGKDPIGAVRYLQKILIIDRGRRDISDRIKQLYLLDEKHRAHQRSVFMTFAALVCISILGGLYFLYDTNVRQAYFQLDVKVKPYLNAKPKDYQGAIDVYNDFMKQHPLSWSARQLVPQTVKKLDDKKLQYDWKVEESVRKKWALASKFRREYREIYASNVAKFDEEKSAEAALARFDKIRKLVRDAGMDEDRAWEGIQGIEAEQTRLRDYISEARRIEDKFQNLSMTSDVRQARALALQLHARYPFSQSAKRTNLPTELRSEPSGVEIWMSINGAEPTQLKKGAKPLLTPQTLNLPYQQVVQMQFRKEGYERLSFAIRAEEKSPVSHVLRVKPEREIRISTPAFTGLAIGEDDGLIGLRDGWIMAIDMANKHALWKKQLGSLEYVQGMPIVIDGVGIIATNMARLKGFDMSNKKELWSHDIPGGVTASSLLATPDGLIVVSRRGVIYSYHPSSGELNWQRDTRNLPSKTAPVVDGDTIWFASGSSRQLLALQSVDGAIVRDLELAQPLRSGPTILDEQLFYVGAEGFLRCIERNGRQLWAKPLGDGTGDAGLVADEDGLLHIDAKGLMRRVNQRNGEILSQRQLPGQLYGSILSTNGHSYIMTKQDRTEEIRITKVSGSRLSVLWEYRFRKGISGSPSLWKGMLVVVGVDQVARVLK